MFHFMLGCDSQCHGPCRGPTIGAKDYVVFADNDLIVCHASNADTSPPSKTGASCKEVKLQNLDPQGKHIWALFNLQMPDDLMDSYEPLGLGLSVKASSLIYINGREVGRNGLPAKNRKTERVGQMDVTFPLRDGILRTGKMRSP